jgi:hypothetical protein
MKQLPTLILLLIIFLSGAGILPAAAQASTILSLTPQALQIAVGETREVAVVVENVEALYGFDVALRFDPAVLAVLDVDSVEEGTQVGFGTFLEPGFMIRNTADNQAGTIRFALTQLNPSTAKSGSGQLIVIRLQARQAGISELSFEKVQLAQRDGSEILAQGHRGEITVSAGVQAGPSPTPFPTQAAGIPLSTVGPPDAAPLPATPAPQATGRSAEATAAATPTARPTGAATVEATATALPAEGELQRPAEPDGTVAARFGTAREADASSSGAVASAPAAVAQEVAVVNGGPTPRPIGAEFEPPAVRAAAEDSEPSAATGPLLLIGLAGLLAVVLVATLVAVIRQLSRHSRHEERP